MDDEHARQGKKSRGAVYTVVYRSSTMGKTAAISYLRSTNRIANRL